MSELNFASLRARYTADPVPPCRVCGGELSIQSMGGGAATVWAHSAPEGTRVGDWTEHYRESRWTQYRGGDSDVIRLVDAVVAAAALGEAWVGFDDSHFYGDALLTALAPAIATKEPTP